MKITENISKTLKKVPKIDALVFSSLLGMGLIGRYIPELSYLALDHLASGAGLCILWKNINNILNKNNENFTQNLELYQSAVIAILWEVGQAVLSQTVIDDHLVADLAGVSFYAGGKYIVDAIKDETNSVLSKEEQSQTLQ